MRHVNALRHGLLAFADALGVAVHVEQASLAKQVAASRLDALHHGLVVGDFLDVHRG